MEFHKYIHCPSYGTIVKFLDSPETEKSPTAPSLKLVGTFAGGESKIPL